MKLKMWFGLIVGILLLAGGVLVAGGASKQEPALESQKDKMSYSMGLQAGKSLAGQNIDINSEIFLRGLNDGRSGQQPLLTPEQIRDTAAAFRKETMAKQAEQLKQLAEKNQREGQAFLAENAKKEGVVTLPSGLQYKVVKAGAGKKPKEGDTVTINYRGTFVDGTEFGNSLKRGKPESFPLKGMIKGWGEALPLMEEGAQWQVFIPANLAYGEKGGPKGSGIGPNATLIFDVELVSTQEKPPEPPAAPAKKKAPRGIVPNKPTG